MLCVCGASCDDCHYIAECDGTCAENQGRVFWTKTMNLTACPIYQCAQEHGYQDCGDCTQLPCKTWFAVKDPAVTDEQHQKSIEDRAAKLTLARSQRENTGKGGLSKCWTSK